MTDVSALLHQADSLAEKNQIPEAKQLYAEVVRMDPGNPDGWYMLGLIEQEQANPTLAETHLRRAIDLDDQFADAHLNLANLLRQQARIDEAKRHARLAVGADEEHVEAWVLLGGLELDSEEFAAALACFGHALRYWPDNPVLLANLGHSQAGVGQLENAKVSFERAISLGARSADDHLALARVNLPLKRYADAVANATAALEKAPTRTDIQHFLANALIAAGRATEALSILNKLVGTGAANADILFSCGGAHHALKDIENARDWYERACLARPDSALFHASLANAESQLGHFDKVIEECRRALALQPGLDEASLLLANALHMTGAFSGAVSTYRALIQKQPDNRQALAGLMETYEKIGDIEAGQRLLGDIPESCLREVPGMGLAAAKLYAHVGKQDEAIQLLVDLLKSIKSQNEAVGDNVLIGIHNQLGKLLDRAERYEEAFSQFGAANNLRRSTFVATEHVREIDGIMANWRAEDLSAAPVSANPSRQPLFIVGMPRSGSTLAEQILSSHPLVTAGGELQIIPQIAARLSGQTADLPFASPRCSGLTKAQLGEAAEVYIGVLKGMDSQARYVTDKLPYNYLHLGLISVLFPQARIIHCKRSPLDTCISTYIQNFSGPRGFAASLEAIGAVYTQYLRLMDHWRSIIANPVFELSYEALVDDQERTTRALLEFCGLPWDERCLSFQNNTRTALTASYNQVRQPMYRSSIDRWKNYESHLGPLIAALGN